MKDEIAAAVVFLTRIVKGNTNLSAEQLSRFSERLALILVEKFRNHWYEDKPSKGQAYRCIRVGRNEPRDSVLDKTARDCSIHYNHLNLPAELTLWIDPMEVSCRFGERGTLCEVARFSQSSQTDNMYRSSSTISVDNGNEPVRDVFPRSDNDNTTIPSSSPPSSPRVVNDNLRLVARKSPPHSQASTKSSTQFVFNRNATNTPGTAIRPHNRVWVRQPNPQQYRWVNKSVAARA